MYFRIRRTRKGLLQRFRGALYNTDPGAGGGGAGQPGTGTPGTPTPGSGTGDDKNPDFLTKKEFGQTAAVISGLKKGLETLTGSALTAEKLNETLAASGLLIKQEDGTYKPAFAKPEGQPQPATPPAKNPLEDRLKSVEKQLADAKAEVENERKAVATEKQGRAIIEALRKAGAVNPERDYVHLSQMVALDGTNYFVNTKDSAGNEQRFPLEEYAASWLEGNPELKKPQGAQGSGTKPGAGSAGGAQLASREQFADMEWYRANREKIEKGEIRMAP